MSIKKEEMVPLADMLIESFERDQAVIEIENSFYSVVFLNEFKAMTEEVREMEKADAILVRQKSITKNLYRQADSLKQPLKIFTIAVQKAALLTKLPNQIMSNLKSRNIEGALLKINSLIQVIESNHELLISKGMKAAFFPLLKSSFNEITDLSNLQTALMKEKTLLTDDNNGSYTTLYDMYISDVCSIGKAVFLGSAKANEYTVSKMLKKLHIANGSDGENNKKE